MESDARTHRYDEADALPARPLLRALARGALHRCPACGEGALYGGYLRPVAACARCGEELHHQRADDAPPYVTIFVVGHLVVGAVVGVDIAYAWPLWLHAAVWLPVTVGLCLGSLPSVKGALIGLQWGLRMHGFGPEPDGVEAHPAMTGGGAG